MNVAIRFWEWMTEGRRAEHEAAIARRAAAQDLKDAAEGLKAQARTPLDDIARPPEGAGLNGARHDLDSD